MPKTSSLDVLIEKLNSFSADNYWDLGKFLVEKVVPTALKEGIFGDQALKMMSSVPGGKFSFSMLKQCQQFYTYYPDVGKRPLPDIFYFELATKIPDSHMRRDYEKLAVDKKWTISELRKKIYDDEVTRRQDEKTRYGFDLKEKNIWSIDIPDPRFGKPNYKGRLPGQLVANALFYYTDPGAYIVDPFAGSGTLGDVIDHVAHFSDRRYKMYDIDPSDERIVRNNTLQTGIPEETGSVDYVFLDPPSDFFPKGDDISFSASAAKAESLVKIKGVIRETSRILKKGGKVSIILEPTLGSEFIDFPFEVSMVMRDFGMKPIGKVYLPRKADVAVRRADVVGKKIMASDCREMLTFEKV
jgi:DNA modification methylase